MSTISKVRQWSREDLRFDAAIELLSRTKNIIYPHAPWLVALSPSEVAVEPNDLLEFTSTYSSGERACIAVAASLLGGPPVDLSDVAPNLDSLALVNVLAAVSAAAGGDYLVTPERDPQTQQLTLQPRPNPCPWPHQDQQSQVL